MTVQATAIRSNDLKAGDRVALTTTATTFDDAEIVTVTAIRHGQYNCHTVTYDNGVTVDRTQPAIAYRVIEDAPETVEYMVCDDCRIAIANDDYSAMSDERANDVEDGIMQLSTMGHLMSGDSYDDFSIKSCECCGDRSAGARYGVNQFVSDEA